MRPRSPQHGMGDTDALALFAAYAHALDRRKHGSGIDLPEHVRKLFPVDSSGPVRACP